MSDPANSSPLCWPPGWRRTTAGARAYGRFGSKGSTWGRDDITVAAASRRVIHELTTMGISPQHVVISTNVRVRLDGLPRSNERKPADPGAAVYWQDLGKQRCIAVDRYTDVAQNLAAIAATLDAMRAIERHGGAEILDRAFTGFTALPSSEQWWQVLGFDHSRPSRADVVQRHRELAMQHHPDRGGQDSTMARINAARDQGMEAIQCHT